MNKLTLRGMVLSMFGSIGKFAKALGWSRRKASYIVSGKQEPTAADIEAMCSVLEVEVPEEFRILFLQ